jgi:hypothetical protein
MVDVSIVGLNQTDAEQYAEQLKDHADGEQSTSRGGDRHRKQLQPNGDDSGSRNDFELALVSNRGRLLFTGAPKSNPVNYLARWCSKTTLVQFGLGKVYPT